MKTTGNPAFFYSNKRNWTPATFQGEIAGVRFSPIWNLGSNRKQRQHAGRNLIDETLEFEVLWKPPRGTDSKPLPDSALIMEHVNRLRN